MNDGEDKMIGKAPEVAFKDVHPTNTANNSPISEEGWVSCKQCGFLINTNVTSPGSGWGNETTSSITPIAGGTANAKDPDVGPGCPLCGTSEYN